VVCGPSAAPGRDLSLVADAFGAQVSARSWSDRPVAASRVRPGRITLLNVLERHLSVSHELPIALALLTTRLLQSMVEVVVEGDHGVVGAEGGRSPGRARGGCGRRSDRPGRRARCRVAVPSGHVRVVGTVAVVWVSSRRHGCGTAKAPGREPGPCCWPPGVARQVACYCCPLEGQQSAILRRRDAEARFREPRSSSSSQTADPTTCEATPQIGWLPRPEPSWGGRPRPGRDRLATRGRLSDARALCQDCGIDTCPSEFEPIRRA
jgi:hypothetical protein